VGALATASMRQVSVSDVAAGMQADLQLDGAGAEVPWGQRFDHGI